MADKIRLFKIASEINIGKETIVEYLQSKGFKIENKPTSLLNEDMLDVVYDKFKKEKKAAEVQRDKILKHKDIIPKSGKSDSDEENSPPVVKFTSILEERLEAAKKDIEKNANISEKTPLIVQNLNDKASISAKQQTSVEIPTPKVVESIEPIANKFTEKENKLKAESQANLTAIIDTIKTDNNAVELESLNAERTKIVNKKVKIAQSIVANELDSNLSENKSSENKSVVETKSNNLDANLNKEAQKSDKDNVVVNEIAKSKVEVETKQKNTFGNQTNQNTENKDSKLNVVKVGKKETSEDIADKNAKNKEIQNQLNKENQNNLVNESIEQTEKDKINSKQSVKSNEIVKTETNEVNKDKANAETDENSDSTEPKKRKKRKKIMEVDPFEKVELKGLTIVGKINLDAGRRNRSGGDYRDNRRGNDNRGNDNRGGDNRSNDNRSNDNRGGDNRGSDNRVGGNKFAPRNPVDKGNLTVGRPQGDRPQGDRPPGDNRPSYRDNRPYGDRPQGDRPPGDNRPSYRDNRPQGDRPPGDNRPSYRDNRPYGDRPQGDRPPGDRPQGDRPSYRDNRPGGDNRPYGDRPPGDNRPSYRDNRPGGDNRPYGDRPPGDNRPSYRDNRPGGDNRPYGDRPQGDRPRGAGSTPFESANFGGARPGPKYGDSADKSKVKSKEFGEDAKPKSALDLKKKKKKKGIRDSISSVDVDRAIKETLAEMEDSTGNVRAKIRQKKKLEREEKEQKIQEDQLIESKRLQLSEFVSTSDLASLIGTSPSDIIMRCMKLGLMVTINQRLDKDSISLIADDFGFEVIFVQDDMDSGIEDIEDNEEDLIERPSIVTIMGHVDHGKTSLLDYIRKTKVVTGEAGGITQHIGAYKVNINQKSITFLDTPGHEAFTAMRARGAQLTDIVVLVVAADDMVMPQTIEAISHAKAANVPIIVAINKIDKTDANPDKIRQQLSEHEVLVEDWGGKYQCVEISAKQGINIDNLLEKILLESELMELKANPDRNARGTIVEANMDRGFGSTATVVVQKGTLNIGDAFVAGISSGKVRAMFDETGNKVEVAYPSQPVKVIGFDILPSAGDTFISVSSETEARKIASDRKQIKREQEVRLFKHVTLEDFTASTGLGDVKDLRLIIKADVDGSMEALTDSLLKLTTEEVKINILHKAVGPISESDVMLAVASGAIIVGFHNTATPKAQKLADDEGVEIRYYDIIYDCINDLKNAMEGLLAPDLVEETIGNVEVRALFKNSKIGNIAGCYVLNGKIHRNDKVKVLRDGLLIHTGSLMSLKREKEDVKEVDSGFECGVLVKDFSDIKVNDIIQPFRINEVKRKLK